MDQSSTNKINASLDALIESCNSEFKQFLVAYYVHVFGQNVLKDISDHALLNAIVWVRLEIEPIPVGHLREFNNIYPAFLFEIFHGRFVQTWNTCLYQLFSTLLGLHMSGARNFAELGKRNVSLDFDSSMPSSEQIRENMYSSFKFFKYLERQKVINNALNQKNEGEGDQINVRKNVLVRNSFQHRKGIVDDDLLKEKNWEGRRLKSSIAMETQRHLPEVPS